MEVEGRESDGQPLTWATTPPAGRTGMEKNQQQLTRHSLADELFGNLEKHEFEGLKHGLQENSQGARVWLYQGHVLCGWHTWLACNELELEPEYVEVEASNDAEALLKALSVELRR